MGSQKALAEKKNKEKNFDLHFNVKGPRSGGGSRGKSQAPRKRWRLDGSSIHIKGEKGEDHRLLPRWAQKGVDGNAEANTADFPVRTEGEDDSEADLNRLEPHGADITNLCPEAAPGSSGVDELETKMIEALSVQCAEEEKVQFTPVPDQSTDSESSQSPVATSEGPRHDIDNNGSNEDEHRTAR